MLTNGATHTSKASRCNSQFFAGIKQSAVVSSASGPTSQIPGLSQSADETTPAERTSGRRVGIFASDSEYVKLAKQGGHKGKGYLILSTLNVHNCSVFMHLFNIVSPPLQGC